jgi:CelD/BcsL family acetyltransferase involved in cellulose biosynthesis/peptidoglycan/xylan/chitin deacetylase (PgdA/CDA1 family)
MLSVVRYRSWNEVLELRELWNPLLSRSASDTVFLTWEWMEAWWKNYGNERRLFVLGAWEDKSLLGIAPFFIDEVRLYGITWKRLCLIGDGSHDSDYLDCFAELGREAAVIGHFLSYLKSHQKTVDWIELHGPLRNSPCANHIIKQVYAKGWDVKCEPIRCLALPLPRTWDDYLRQLEPRFRTKVRSSLSLLQQYVKSQPQACTVPEQLQEWLPTLFELHTRRWATQNRPGVFRDEARRNFYRDLSHSALKSGWLAFHRMNWGERTLAAQYGLLYRNRFHLLQEGYDPDFSTVRPGVALRAWLVQHWIDAGLEEYDFLAGVSDYKLDWGAQEKTATRLLIAPTRVARIAALEEPGFRLRVREKVGQFLPRPALAFRKKLISNRARKTWQSPVLPVTDALTVRRLAATAYSATVLGRVGHSLATTYCWNRDRSSTFLPLQRRSQPVCQIFHYHRVNDEADPFLGGLSVNAFRVQMQHLAARFPILTLDQVARGEFPKECSYCIAITFDDGYRDNFVCAFPVLKSLGIPATVFLATGYIDSGELPWYDRVRLAFKLTKREQISLASFGGPCGDFRDTRSRARFSEMVLRWLRGLGEVDRQSAVLELLAHLCVPSNVNLPNQMLRWEDIRQMAKHNISFGAHTITHPVLSRIPGELLQKEIAGSKRAIENRLQAPVAHFAYPFGQLEDFSLEAKRVVQEAGFKTAVTAVWGVNEPDSDLFELRRFAPWQSDPAEFQMKLDWYRFYELQPSQRGPLAAGDLRLSREASIA